MFFISILTSIFFQTLYGMADLFIIGQFNGVDSTTAVFISSKVMHMITVMIVGLDMGFTIMIAHFVGANKRKQTNKAIGNTVTLFILVSVICPVVFFH